MSSTQATHQTRKLAPGTILDHRYEIQGLLGSGGFALVYKALQRKINRTVAIKVLNAPHDPEVQKTYEDRFLREAQTAAQIRHPNVVTIHDYGIHEGQPYIVMELLEGHDLKEEIQNHGALPPSRALPLFCACLDALGEGHEHQIIHKDLKPSNLFITNPGTRREALRVLDFGIARLGEDDTGRLTGTGLVLGTPKYYAPEYARSQIATPALDVYQMALILVESLTRSPVVGLTDAYACLLKHCNGELDIPDALLQSPLGPVLAKALDLDHTLRYPNAHAFREALETIDPTSIPPIPEGAPSSSLADFSFSIKGLVGPSLSTSQRLHSPSQPSPQEKDPSIRLPQPLEQEDMAATRPLQEDDLFAATALMQDSSIRANLAPPTLLDMQAVHNPPAPSARRRPFVLVAMILGSAIFVLGIAAAVFLIIPALTGEPRPPKKPAQEAPASPTTNTPEAKASPVLEEVPTRMEEIVEIRTMKVATHPDGAKIYMHGKLLGEGAVQVDIEEGKSVHLEIKKPGYLETSVTLDHTTHSPMEVVLTRLPQKRLSPSSKAAKKAATKKPAVAKKPAPSRKRIKSLPID